MSPRLPGWYVRNPFAPAGLLLGVAIACAALYVFEGPQRTLAADAGFVEHGRWDYGGPLGVGVYDDDALTSPQPFFLRLGDVLPVRYDYSTSASDPSVRTESQRGTYGLVAQVRAPNGWARTFPLSGQRTFEGAGFATAADLDLRRVADLVSALEAATDYRSPTYRLRLIAHVNVEALVAGQPVARSFDHALDFTVTDLEVRLDDPVMLESNVEDLVTYPTFVPREFTLPIAGVAVPHAALPSLATGALFIAVVLLAFAMVVIKRAQGEPHSIASLAVNSRWLVDVGVGSVPTAAAQSAVLLTSLSALLQLAEHYQTPVLRVRDGATSSYWLLTDVVYAHRPAHLDAYRGARQAA